MVALAPHLAAVHRDTRRASADWLTQHGFLESGLGWNLFYRPVTDRQGKPAMVMVSANSIAICDVVAVYEQTTGTMWTDGMSGEAGGMGSKKQST